MTMLQKSAPSILDYSFDWNDILADGEQITGASWSIDPAEAGGLQIDSQLGSGAVQGVVVSGGVVGQLYRLSCLVTTDQGRSISRGHGVRILT